MDTKYLNFSPITMVVYNYDTHEYVTIDGAITSDELALTLLPPGPARALYPLYRQVGQSIAEALKNVLVQCVPSP